MERVEFSDDGGRTWQDARIGERVSSYGWWSWPYAWETGEPGEYELPVRATDSAENTQPLDASEVWNTGTYGINTAQRVPVVVRAEGSVNGRTDEPKQRSTPLG